MFSIQVHLADGDKLLPFEFSRINTPRKKASSNPNKGPKLIERRGITHLFRSFEHVSLPNPISRSTLLFAIAVPNYLSFEDFIRFIEVRIDHIVELVFLRSDGVEDHYSVLIRLKNQKTADGFFCVFNGKKFLPGEAEVCHLLFLHSAVYAYSAEIAGTPADGCTELPTCPVCLERLDPDTGGILSTVRDHSFQGHCTAKSTELSCQVCRYCHQKDDKPACTVCGTTESLWVCVICGFVGCGRYEEGHALRHWKDTKHCYSLDLTTKQNIWGYVGASYVHRLNQSRLEGKYGEMNNFRCIYDGDCASCTCSENSGFSGLLYNSKVDTNYESLLIEARSRLDITVSEAVERAVTSKMQDIQNKQDKWMEEKNAVVNMNLKLIKDQETLRNKYKEIEERAIQFQMSKDKDANERMAAFEKKMSSVHETLQILGKMVDPVPQLQDDLGHLSGQISSINAQLNLVQTTIDAKLGEVYETMRRMENLMTKQGSSSGPEFRHLEMGQGGGQEKRSSGQIFSGPNRGHYDHRKKLELPLFEGDNPHGWLFQAERYFPYHAIAEEDKVMVASFCLEGRALSWFQWVDAKTPFHSWQAFRSAILVRFSHLGDEDPTEQLLALHQEGTVADFRDQFEVLAAALPQLPESVFKGAFLNGLRDDIRVEVKLLRPADLDAVMLLAQQVEEHNSTLERSREMKGLGQPGKLEGGGRASMVSDFSAGQLTFGAQSGLNEHLTAETPAKATGSQGATEGTSGVFRRLSDTELNQRRAQGLCYRCDGKFSLGHRCPNREVQVLLVTEGDMDMVGDGIDFSGPSSSSSAKDMYKVKGNWVC